MAGYIAVPYMGAYGATKRALNGISRAARLELEGTGVSVVNICPGYVKTDFGENAVHGAEGKRISASIRRGITADRVAQAVLRAYQCDVTGDRRPLDEPLSNWLGIPGAVRHRFRP